jgi:inner membrane protein
MPSPIIHLTAGYIVYRVARTRLHTPARREFVILAWALVLSLLPDFDAIPGLLAGDLGRYHNNLSHSLWAGVVVALAVACLLAAWRLEPLVFWFGLALACYSLHIVLDYFTQGRGVMALWPLSSDRFSSPVPLFYGLHWSEGLVSHRHLWTLLTELPIAGALVLAIRRVLPEDHRRRPVRRSTSNT